MIKSKLKMVNKLKKHKEIIFSVLTIVILIIGFICDFCLVGKNYDLVESKYLPTIAITLIQVQACLTTLVIAIIALLSGFITKSYLGIPICKYYLDIKPSIFKFKNVLLFEFLLISFSVVGQIYESYNFIVYVFFAAMLVIVTFIIQIYGIFEGENNNAEEIKTYFLNRVEKDDNYKTNGELFIRDWKRTISKEPLEEFKSNFEIFVVLINKIILKDHDVKTANSFLENIALYLLNDESISSKKKGIKFVNDCYNTICNSITNNINLISKLNSPITLFNRIHNEWWHALNSVDEETVKKHLNYFIFKNVLKLSSCFTNNEQNQSMAYEQEAVYVIAKSLGELRGNLSRKNLTISSELWKYLICHFDNDIQNLPSNAAKTYFNSQALFNFNLYVSFIHNKMCAIVKDDMFISWLNTIDYRAQDCLETQFKSYIFELLLIHCYAYYLAFCEDSNIVGTQIQTEVVAMLTDQNVIKNIKNLYFTLSRYPQYLTKELAQKLEKTLDWYECFPSGSGFKACVINDVVRDYFLYLVLICNKYKMSNSSDLLYELDADKYMFYLSKNAYDSRKQHFSNLATIFGSNTSEITSIFIPFDLYLQKEIKNRKIKEYNNDQQAFNNLSVKNKIKTTIKHNFSSHFNEFDNLSEFDSKNIKTYKKVYVAKVLDYTKCLNENEEVAPAYIEAALANFTNFLGNQISSDFGIKSMIRTKDFKSDQDFLNFLKNNQYNTLIGDQNIFQCTNYEKYDEYLEHNNFIKTQNTFFIPYSSIGIATKNKAIYIKLNEVIVDITPAQINEINSNDYSFDPNTKLYKYQVGFGISIDLDNKEFQNLIQNERKLVNIYFDVTLGIKDCQENGNQISILRNQ